MGTPLRLQADLVEAYIRACDRVTIIELNIGNERRAGFSDDFSASPDFFVRAYGDTDNIAPRLFEHFDLGERARVIERGRVRHRLNRNRFAPADIKISDFYSARHTINPRISTTMTNPNNKIIPTA